MKLDCVAGVLGRVVAMVQKPLPKMRGFDAVNRGVEEVTRSKTTCSFIPTLPGAIILFGSQQRKRNVYRF